VLISYTSILSTVGRGINYIRSGGACSSTLTSHGLTTTLVTLREVLVDRLCYSSDKDTRDPGTSQGLTVGSVILHSTGVRSVILHTTGVRTLPLV